MATRADAIQDLVTNTIKAYKKKRWVDLSLDLQSFEFAQNIEGKKRQTEDGGITCAWNVQVRNNNNARNNDLYDTDVISQTNLMVQAQLDWTHQTAGFGWDEREPVLNSSDSLQIVAEIQARVHAMWNEYYTLQEQNLWGAPTSDVAGAAPKGIPFWIQKDASTTPAGGFNGGNPTGYSGGAAGINASTYPRWKNWAGAHDNTITEDTLGRIASACDHTVFIAPHSFAELGKSTSPDRTVYTTHTMLQQFRSVLRGQNESLGMDLGFGFKEGTPVYNSIPIKWVPYLDSDTSNPIYGVNWKTMQFVILKGFDRRQTNNVMAAGAHLQRMSFIDTTCQYRCYNRRTQWVLSS